MVKIIIITYYQKYSLILFYNRILADDELYEDSS